MSIITESAVAELARLAGLRLSPVELTATAAEIERLRSFIARLPAGPPCRPEAASAEWPREAVSGSLRVDEVRPGLTHDEALAGAPSVESGHFAVPNFVESRNS